MVLGSWYLSGRERSLARGTEFRGALGANVGPECSARGCRALLKFFPVGGNVVCGMVAGAGTYAIDTQHPLIFLEGVTPG